MRKILVIILLFSLCFSCKKKPFDTEPPVEEAYKPVQIPCTLTGNIDTIKQRIQGIWIWLEEKRWIDLEQKFVYLTPKTQGFTRRMKLYKDTVVFYKNDVVDEVNTYKIIKWGEVTGTNFAEDEWTVIAYYRIPDGIRIHAVPLKICEDYMVQQHQYVSSIVGPWIWKKQ